MNSKTKRAIIARVSLGFTEIEGLMMPDGTYAIAVPQLADVFQFLNKNASRDIKRLLGGDFSFLKIASELNPKAVNIIPIQDVARLIFELAKQGNPIANEFMIAIIEEGLDRRFARAFNQRVDEEEYDARIRQRMDRILARYEYTDFIRDRHYSLHRETPPPKLYRQITVKVNQRLFGRPHFFCNRDNMTPEQQQRITQFETFVSIRAEKNPQEEPEQTIDRILEVFDFNI